MSAAFDTLRLARSLRDKAQFSSEQAEGVADAIAEAMQGELATKADLALTKADLRAEIQSVRTEIQAVRTEVQATKADLRADIAAAKTDTVRWVVGMIGFQTLAMIGAVLALACIFAK